MSLRLGIVMDPIASISFKKDSSLAMLLAAQARGWSLFYMEQQDLYQVRGQARARVRPLEVFNDPQRWFTLGMEQDTPLAELDVILMRKDPPFDNEFVYSTYLLEQAERAGVLVVNRPQSLRDCNEKFFATLFPGGMYSSAFGFFMNEDKWNKLPKQDQEAIEKLAGEHIARLAGNSWDEADKKGMEALKKSGVKIVEANPAFVAEVKKRSAPIIEKWIADAKSKGIDGAKVLAEFREELKKVAAGK